MSDNENDIELSDYSMKALLEYYVEMDTNAKSNLVDEDWELSQFWYNKSTAETLTEIVLKGAGENGKIACVSVPTVFTELHKRNSDGKYFLFEYDKRFHEKFVLVDPPYLSRECLEKISQTVKLLTKDKIILCTGAVMEDCAKEFLGLVPSKFIPKHANKLGNEFKCYTNWNFD